MSGTGFIFCLAPSPVYRFSPPSLSTIHVDQFVLCLYKHHICLSISQQFHQRRYFYRRCCHLLTKPPSTALVRLQYVNTAVIILRIKHYYSIETTIKSTGKFPTLSIFLRQNRNTHIWFVFKCNLHCPPANLWTPITPNSPAVPLLWIVAEPYLKNYNTFIICYFNYLVNNFWASKCPKISQFTQATSNWSCSKEQRQFGLYRS